MYRTPQLHNGGTIDLLYGARYLQLNDVFQVYGTGGPFDAMEITQKVLNNVVGPQIGARYAHQRGRWSVWSEGRFFPSANFAVERNTSILASNSQPSTTANVDRAITRTASRTSGHDHRQLARIIEAVARREPVRPTPRGPPSKSEMRQPPCSMVR